MKKFSLFAVALALVSICSLSAAEFSSSISGVHLCCDKCVKGVETAVATVTGVTANVDKNAGTVTLKAEKKGSVQQAADALVKAGYFGTSSDSSIKLAAKTGAKGKKVQSAKVSGVHLCCDKCTKAVDAAVKSVAGVTSHDAKKGAESFTVTGDFNDKDLATALHKAGLTGKLQ